MGHNPTIRAERTVFAVDHYVQPGAKIKTLYGFDFIMMHVTQPSPTIVETVSGKLHLTKWRKCTQITFGPLVKGFLKENAAFLHKQARGSAAARLCWYGHT